VRIFPNFQCAKREHDLQQNTRRRPLPSKIRSLGVPWTTHSASDSVRASRFRHSKRLAVVAFLWIINFMPDPPTADNHLAVRRDPLRSTGSPANSAEYISESPLSFLGILITRQPLTSETICHDGRIRSAPDPPPPMQLPPPRRVS